ncbi:hypothetical protein BCR42DRAFT_429230 [Absidia repens]|uniref:Uncharacterized protein n=1 Tax=Absidia repens TaxID=90262 RepID=A0A1X2HX28_9FUNG|nr:hypothetical protein BCR42DRAFT_429230 [Absidia repens]
MTSHLLYSGQPHQSQASLYNVYQQQQQRPLFLPQQLSPVTTPDYTDDSSDQFNLTTSTPPTTSFHYTDITTNGFSKPDNAIHQHYPIPPTAYLPHTPAPAAAAATASSSSAHSLSHIPTSSSCPPAVQHQHQHQTTSCQTMDIYNNFAMDDLISFDSQNTGMPLIDNAVWYC